jgi:Na+/H+ antiporter
MAGHELEIVLLALLAGTTTLVVLSRFTEVPYPILLVVGGLALSFTPGLPDVRLDPDVVFTIFLPPLLYVAAFFTSVRDLRANIRPITFLAVGLVFVTTAAVGVVGHQLGLSVAAAFVLGAVVSPTDPLAATAIARRLHAPRRVVTIIEGESLVNDGTALVLYSVAVTAAATGSFSAVHAGVDFFGGILGGVAVGLASGWLVAQVRRRLPETLPEVTLTLASPYFAYLPAEILGVSGVIAVVTSGVYVGWVSPELSGPNQRLQGFATWEVLQFVLNAALFVLIGLQLPVVVGALHGVSAGELIGEAAAIAGTVIAVRLLWVVPATYLPRMLSRRLRERDPAPPLSHTIVVAWTGLRGAVSLAAALALPLTAAGGGPFPNRDRIVFLAFVVVLVTLLVQGLSLPALIRRLGIADGGEDGRHEDEIRVRAAQAALARIDELEEEPWVRDASAERLRDLYEYRLERFRRRAEEDGGRSELDDQTADFARLRVELINAERDALLGLRRRGEITEEVMRRIERDLDLEESRVGDELPA